jgi:hypothetical protein
VNVTILLWAAILTYPVVARRAKDRGRQPGIHAVNLLRIITLFYLGQYNKNWFDFAHYYLWRAHADTLVIFCSGVAGAGGRQRHAAAV